IDEGIADPDRIAIMGGSYGGYATLAGLAFTPELYAAGVDIVGPSNIVTLLNSIPPYWKPLQKLFAVRVGDLSDPQDVERMQTQSPLNSATAITAPLLVIQGANDPRVKKAESDQIVVALREKGQDVEYIVAANEGHGFANEDNNLAMFAKTEEFLATHLGGRYQEGMPPEIEETLAGLTVDVGAVELASATGEGAGEPIVAFDGSAVDGDTRGYEQKAETQGQTIELASTRTVTTSDWEGRAALLIVESAQGATGSAVDSTWVDPQTLAPIRRTIHQGPAKITLAFADDAVTGEIQAGPQTLPVDVQTEGAVFSSGPALELGLSTLPLEPGSTASIQLFEVLEGKVKPFRVEVREPETVETPAGSFDAVPIALTPMDGSPGGQTVYVETAEPNRVVKVDATLPAMMGGGTATAVLAPAE
ncbi:MAG: prolyl oligopeptidase family serine peptidase, partial [Gemmatimonadota bacterium]